MHSCPECWQACHCGGDIDDMCFDDTQQQMRCIHCEGIEDYDDHEYYDDQDGQN